MPPVGQAQPQGGQPGGVRNAVAQGISEAGWALIGSAFAEAANDPNVAIPFQQIGQNISATLNDRWWRQEYDNFVAEHGERFKTGVMQQNEMLNRAFSELDRGMYTDPSTGITQDLKIDTESGMLMSNRLRDNLLRESFLKFSSLTQDYMGAAGRYVNNPYINSEIQNVLAFQSNQIAQLTSPPSGAAQRAGVYKDIRQAGMYSRSPAQGAGGTSARDAAMSGLEWWQKKGGGRNAASFFTSNPSGREFLKQYYDDIRAEAEQTILSADPSLRDDPTALKRMVDQRTSNGLNWAYGRFVRDQIPGGYAELQAHDWGKKYVEGDRPDLPRADRHVGRVTVEEQKTMNEQWLKNAYEAFAKLIRREPSGTSYQQTLDMFMDEWVKPNISTSFGSDKASRQVAKKVYSYLTTKLSNKSAVMEALPIARETWGGKKKKSLLAAAPEPSRW